MSRILVDYHHTSLLRSLIMLFEDRLGHKIYRPIGLDWYTNGFWKINDNPDTAKQYLSLEQVPKDGTPKLNRLNRKSENEKGIYYCYDGGSDYINRACTLKYFREKKFDYVICSIPQHIPVYKKLINYYQPKAKLIVQVGNEWPEYLFCNQNVLASIKPRELPDANTFFYHQEFSLDIFYPSFEPRKKKIYCFVNVLQEKPADYQLFLELEKLMPGWEFKLYGGQNRDGNLSLSEIADKMREAAFVFQCKTGGDGYGHILWNSAFTGTPLITRYEDYANRLGQSLMTEETSIFVDQKTPKQIAWEIDDKYQRPMFNERGKKIYELASESCNFEAEAEGVGAWLANL